MAEGGALRDLLARFSVDVDTKSLTAFEAGVSGVFQNLQKYAGIFAGMFALNALKNFVSESIQAAGELKDLAGRLQVSTDEFQKIQRYLKGSAEETAAAIQRLNRGIGSAKAGEKSPIEKLGISLKDAKGELKPTSELVLEMADKVSAMKTPAEKTAAVLDVFGRSAGGLIKPLSKGRKAAEDYFKEFKDLGGVVDKDFIEQSDRAEKEMKKFHIVMGGLKRDMVAALLPTVLKVAEGFKNFSLKIKNLLANTNAIQHFIAVLKFGAVVSGIYKIVTAMRALSFATLTNPFVLLIAAGIALFLVIDDLWTLLEGGDSLIGDALGPDKEQFVASLTDAFLEMKAAFADLSAWLKEIGADIGQIALDKLIEGFRTFFQGIAAGVKWLEYMLDLIKNIKSGAIDAKALLTGDFSSVLPKAKEGQVVANPAQTAVASVPMKQDNSVKVENRNTIQVSVETSSPDSPEKVGKAVGQGVRSQLDKMNVDAINAGKKK